MGKPLFKASDGGLFENLSETGNITQSEQRLEIRALRRLKVRPEAFPNGLPMSA